MRQIRSDGNVDSELAALELEELAISTERRALHDRIDRLRLEAGLPSKRHDIVEQLDLVELEGEIEGHRDDLRGLVAAVDETEQV